jgi:hypothetical protein
VNGYEPTWGSPADNSGGYHDSIGWDIADGLRLNVGQPHPDGSLTIHVTSSAATIEREVTPDQVDEFARLLSWLSGRQRGRQAVRR